MIKIIYEWIEKLSGAVDNAYEHDYLHYLVIGIVVIFLFILIFGGHISFK